MDRSIRPTTQGIVNEDGIVYVLSDDFTYKDGAGKAQKVAKILPDKVEVEGDTGKISSLVYESNKRSDTVGFHKVNYSMIGPQGLSSIHQFKIEHRAKHAAGNLGKVAIYFLDKESNQNEQSANARE